MPSINNLKRELESSGYCFEHECTNLIAALEFKTYFLLMFSPNPATAYVMTFHKRSRGRKANYAPYPSIEGTLPECLHYLGAYANKANEATWGTEQEGELAVD